MLDVAVHEAGHTIVLLELGQALKAVWVDAATGRCECEPEPLRDAWVDPRDHRENLDFKVAGCIAANLFDEWTTNDYRWMDDEDWLAVAACAEYLGESTDRYIDYPSRIIKNAADNATLMEASDFKGLIESASEYPDPEAEILAAERRVEEILKRRWDDVVKLAHSLCRRKTHRMTAKQVFRLLGAEGWSEEDPHREERSRPVEWPADQTVAGMLANAS